LSKPVGQLGYSDESLSLGKPAKCHEAKINGLVPVINVCIASQNTQPVQFSKGAEGERIPVRPVVEYYRSNEHWKRVLLRAFQHQLFAPALFYACLSSKLHFNGSFILTTAII